MADFNRFFATPSQPTINFSPSDLLLIAEALEHYGSNLLYACEDINMVELTNTARLHEEINNYLDNTSPV